MLTSRGIKANPDKSKVIPELCNPTKVNEVQRIIGRIIALPRFLFRSLDRERLFLLCLKKPIEFQWTEQCEAIFWELMGLLAVPPILSSPEPKEKLSLYLSVTNSALNTMLDKEGGKSQCRGHVGAWAILPEDRKASTSIGNRCLKA